MPSFLGSRAARLADHLRDSLRQGRLADPLPGMRLWSRQLGVSRPTLAAAVGELRREGWLSVHARGVRLNSVRPELKPLRPSVVRMLMLRAWRPWENTQLEMISGPEIKYRSISSLENKLRSENIDFTWEACDPARLRAIARRPRVPHELLILASVPPRYQKCFDGREDVLVWGEAEAGSPRPFVAVDYAAAVGHAAFHLMRHGFRRLTLVHIDVPTVGLARAIARFHAACAEWPQQPVVGRTLATEIDSASLMATARRVGRKTRERQGVIVLSPVPVGMVMTALMQHGHRLPEDAEVMALFHTREAIQLYPPPIHYPFPSVRMIASTAEMALSYFRTGRLPSGHKMILADVAGPSRRID